MTTETYNILVVDDEFLARKLLVDYISKIDSLRLVAQCSNAFEAITYLQKERIDILLLDIQMPDITGLELLRSLKNAPCVIFTTAYSEYAVESYDLDVVDYVLKPIGLPRFYQAINKAIDRLERQHSPNQNIFITETVPSVNPTNDFLMVKANYKIYKINFDGLLFIEGQHEYVTFNLVGRRITALYSLRNLEEQLPLNLFIRVHKSFIVSLRHIEDIEGNTINIAGNKIPIGGSYRDELMNRLMK